MRGRGGGRTAASLTRAALALACAPAGLLGAAPARADGPVAFAVVTKAEAPNGVAQVNGGVSLTMQPAESLQTRINLDLNTGDQPQGLLWPGAAPASDRSWRDVGVGLAADWAASSAAKVELKLGDRLKTLPVAPASLGESEAPQNERVEQTAELAATVKPLSTVEVRLSGQVKSADDEITDYDAASSRMQLKSRDGLVSTTLHWALLPGVALDAGAKLSSTSVLWREQASASQAYSAVQPTVAATWTPFAAAGPQLRLGLERAVSPVDATKFVTLARVSDVDAPTRLQPDQEWRLQGELKQTLPDKGALRLAVTEAQIGSATELVRLPGDVEGPGSVPGGARHQVDVLLNLPLTRLGLRSLSVETSGVWRRSEVQDPLTGLMRRPSGEAPYEAKLSLAQTLGKRGLKWGVDTRAVGAQSFYGLAQVTSAEPDQTFDAFVEYAPQSLTPQAFTVRLQLDNLTGQERRWEDAYYTGERDAGLLNRVVHRDEGGPGFHLSLKRNL